MRLLIITQKVDVNDDVLGFFHHWLEKFSEKLDKVYTICLWQGEYDLPQNVSVYSLGKERRVSKVGQFFRLQKYLIQILPKVDGIFVHMCPIYAIASFPLAKIFRKKMILWFLHRSVNWKLKLAEKWVDKILTASEESCRLKNRKKIEIVGHGIDTDQFRPLDFIQASPKFRILSAGRISPIKDQETLIKAIDILVNQKSIRDIEVRIIGSPLEEEEKRYFEKLKNLVREKKLENYIKFLGGVSNNQMPHYYQSSDLVINLSHTGSIDKVVLEAIACDSLVLTCNEAFQNVLNGKYLFRKKDFRDLAGKIISLRATPRDKSLREIVIKNHNLDNLIGKIIDAFQE